MNNINYKYTTFGLLFLLVVTYAWHWQAILGHVGSDNSSNMSGMNMNGSHMMPNGQMMSNDGMNMDDMTMNEMVGMMNGKTGKALEKEFLAGMVPHHQGAIDMARLVLADPTVSAQVKAFAQEIITAQDREIKMMNEWLKNY